MSGSYTAVLFLSSIGFAVYAACDFYIYRPIQEPSFVITFTHDLGPKAIGRHLVGFNVYNPSGYTRRILGFNDYCGKGYCLECAEEQVVSIPPYSSVAYNCFLYVNSLGPFDAKVTIFLEDSGVREEVLSVHGVGIK